MGTMIRHPPLIPPPVYEHDPETSSILSATPSYVSDRPPTYSRGEQASPASTVVHSGPPSAADSTATLVDDTPSPATSQAPAPVPYGLPALRYAPGFTARASGPVQDLSSHSYNIESWSSIRSSNAAKQYQNVAARRMTSPASPSASSSSIASAASATCLSPSYTSYPSAPTSATDPAPPSPPLDPREDPALVGESAASRAKAQRMYREMCMRGDEGLRREGNSWDFMLAQMNDWEERSRSWARFRSDVTARRGGLGGFGGKILGKKIALSGLKQKV